MNSSRNITLGFTLAVAVTAWFTLRSIRKSHAYQNLKSVIVIGDSQVKRNLGQAFKDQFSEIDVKFFGKEGATHIEYLNNPELQNSVQTLGCADLIIIQLGDNGVSANVKKITEFVEWIKNQCPSASIVWMGPMRAVNPTISSYYVSNDPSNPRYLPTYNQTRQVWDTRLRTALQNTDVQYISNFELQSIQPVSSPFSNQRRGDGIHLAKDSADELARLVKTQIIESTRG